MPLGIIIARYKALLRYLHYSLSRFTLYGEALPHTFNMPRAADDALTRYFANYLPLHFPPERSLILFRRFERRHDSQRNAARYHKAPYAFIYAASQQAGISIFALASFQAPLLLPMPRPLWSRPCRLIVVNAASSKDIFILFLCRIPAWSQKAFFIGLAPLIAPRYPGFDDIFLIAFLSGW